MDITKPVADVEPEKVPEDNARAAELQQIRETLRNDYGVQSMFVRVKTLSKIIGIAPATIYTAMRENRFALPHRVVCSVPVVRTDHVIEWICASEPNAKASSARDEQSLADVDALTLSQGSEPSGRMARRQLRKRLVAETLAKMRGECGQADGGVPPDRDA